VTSLSASLHSLDAVPRLGETGREGDASPPPYSYVFLSPIWPSVSKGAAHAPGPDLSLDLVAAEFAVRPPALPVVALGGLTPDTARLVSGLGFSGGAALGAVWDAPNPAAAWAAFVAGLDAGEAAAAAAASP